MMHKSSGLEPDEGRQKPLDYPFSPVVAAAFPAQWDLLSRIVPTSKRVTRAKRHGAHPAMDETAYAGQPTAHRANAAWGLDAPTLMGDVSYRFVGHKCAAGGKKVPFLDFRKLAAPCQPWAESDVLAKFSPDLFHGHASLDTWSWQSTTLG